MTKDRNISTVQSLLENVLDTWSECEGASSRRRILGEKISDRLSPHDLDLRLVRRPQLVGKPVVRVDNQAAVGVAKDDSGELYLLKVEYSPEIGWTLTSFKAQCPCCFGVGVNEDSPCELCGGEGWGPYSEWM